MGSCLDSLGFVSDSLSPWLNNVFETASLSSKRDDVEVSSGADPCLFFSVCTFGPGGSIDSATVSEELGCSSDFPWTSVSPFWTYPWTCMSISALAGRSCVLPCLQTQRYLSTSV